jgi:hypothetical protein
MDRRIPLHIAGAALTVLLAACGTTATSATAPSGTADPHAPEANPPGDIPDNQAFVPYSPPGGGFTVSVPEGWARADGGSTVSFTDNLNTITVETLSAGSAPTVDSVTRTEVPEIQAGATGFSLGGVSTVQRKAGQAVRVTYTADGPRGAVTSNAKPNAVERYEFYRSGTEVAVTLAGPVGADNVDPWRIVTDSFGWR